MYELIDGTISILGGVYVFLAAIGKLPMSKDEQKSQEWIEKYGRTMKIAGPLLILFGLYRYSQIFIG